MEDLISFYSETVRDHARHPRWRAVAEDVCCKVQEANALCGDRVRLGLRPSPGALLDIGCDVRGCIISLASASFMCEAVQGMPVQDAYCLCHDFMAAAREARDQPWPHALASFAAFEALRHFPARVGCACLPWQALERVLKQHARCGDHQRVQ
jgi:nitrogen fixation NifU-like protein